MAFRYPPALTFQGMCGISSMVSLSEHLDTSTIKVAIYYNLICAWIQLYLFVIITGMWDNVSSCRNSFNTVCKSFKYVVLTTPLDCQSSLEDKKCALELNLPQNMTAFFFNNSCYSTENTEMREVRRRLFKNLTSVAPAEEFFEYPSIEVPLNTFDFRNYILEKSNSMDDLGGINWKLFISLAIAWLITAVVLLKGVETMGKITPITDQLAYVVASTSMCLGTVPYVIIIVLLFRGVTLDGSGSGIAYYLSSSNWAHVFRLEVSYSSRKHNIKARLRRGELQRHMSVIPWQ